MSCFDLTKGLCEELNMIIARYWWSQQDKRNKIHWLSWEKLTRSKMRNVEHSILLVMSELSTVRCDRELGLWIAGTQASSVD